MSETDVARCGARLARLGDDAVSMEDAATKIVTFLYENLLHDRAGAKACTLIRFYKTHPFEDLDDELQAFAMARLGDEPFREGMRCLTLLATVGENRQWDSRANSKSYKAIPLPSETFVASIPMLSRLIVQFGLDMRHLVRPDPAQFADQYDVFHVAEAVGSPYILAQDDFVIPYGVKSVLGFGGLLDTGDLFATILFAKVPISAGVAERFTPMALDIRQAVLPFTDGPIFSATQN
jgi:hypothetical protein